jgi:hypothetical protein
VLARLLAWSLVLAVAVVGSEAIGRALRPPAPSTIPPSGVALPSASEEGEIYVGPLGSDSNSGSIDQPLRTPQAAANAAQPGTAILLRAGTYGPFRIDHSGETGLPITISSFPGERAIIDGSGTATRVIGIFASHDIVLSHITIQGAVGRDDGSGLYVSPGSHDITVEESLVRSIDGYGILLDGITKVTVRDNQITDTATAIRIRTGGDQVLIERNRIFRNDRMIINDRGGNNDYGAQGVAFQFTTGHVTVRNNVIYGQRAESFDYGQDGAAFEVFGASNLEISGNVVWDNANVLETGTDGSHPCSNITFVRNVAYNAATWGESRGLILRCAAQSLFAQNTIDGLDRWAFQVDAHDPTFGGRVDGLRILNNILVGSELLIDLPVALPGSAVIDYDLLSSAVPGIARLHDRVLTLAQLRQAAGLEQHGVVGNPGFVDARTRDYHLLAASDAIDIGVVLPGVNDGYGGVAPDAGAFESE